MDRDEAMTAEEREFFGKIVRTVWIEWAKEQPNPKPSWLESWENLSEADREVDRRIGEKIVEVATGGRWQEAVQAERQACAEIARTYEAWGKDAPEWAAGIADAIEARKD